MTTALIIGLGDMGERIAAGLATGGRVERLVLASRSLHNVEDAAAAIAAASGSLVEPAQVDATRLEDVAHLIDRVHPHLIVQCASLRNPSALAGRTDAAARGVVAAGFALRLPYQLPVVLNVMRAAEQAGFTGPVANLSLPDVTGPVLKAVGHAPRLGLGNAGMMMLRARAALRVQAPQAEVPLVRVLAHHHQLDGVMEARPPASPQDRCRVFLGEDGTRDDDLAYRPPGLEPHGRGNFVTAAAAIPVLEALLPEGGTLRWSVPAPDGLPGGYPVRIEAGEVALDLPPDQPLDEAIAFNERIAKGDGVERIDPDGTVHFTDAARSAVATFAPDLAEPLKVADLDARAELLDEVLG
ncbi:KR domain-containing protein [Glycomyces sp. NPDC046736]|uniref:KR domain-containing protein n=1 Tax=Glycomyces sp. NPDC046736 TaxID=3155615 RepID=UPI0033D336CB